MTKDEAIRSILDGAAAEPHSGTMCVPENECGTCDGIRALLAEGRKEGFEKAREMAATLADDAARAWEAAANASEVTAVRLRHDARLGVATDLGVSIRAMQDGEGA